MNLVNTDKNKGFTLVEIAIVMVIFGLIIGGIMGPLKTQLANIEQKEVEKNIESIKEALIGFTIINGWLPCPDTTSPPDGKEDRTAGDCDNESGGVPWVELGVALPVGWKQPLVGTRRPVTYRVTEFFADNDGATDGSGCADTNTTTFELCSEGDIKVLDKEGGSSIVEKTPAIIVFHGKNWRENGDKHEKENSDSDAVFVDFNDKYQAQKKKGITYDDTIGWVNPNVLMGKMVSANKLKAPTLP